MLIKIVTTDGYVWLRPEEYKCHITVKKVNRADSYYVAILKQGCKKPSFELYRGPSMSDAMSAADEVAKIINAEFLRDEDGWRKSISTKAEPAA
jgi:hypothetical protein